MLVLLFFFFFFFFSFFFFQAEDGIRDAQESRGLGDVYKRQDQDAVVFIFQQHGLRSRGFNGAYFAGQEKRVHRFHEMIESYFEE